jgi:3-oxoacyl-[acyl-carrier protein] reductase
VELQLRGRVALVCGGSSGLGSAVAEGLLTEGVRVVINGRDATKLDAAVARLGGGQRGVSGIPADVSRAEECAALVERNAGGPPAGAFETHDAQAWQRALEISLLSTIHLARAALPHMRARRWGRILCLTSVAARQPAQSLILSTTARAGVLGFAKALADEVAAEGITVNVLCPGYFATERLRDLAQARATAQGTTADAVLTEMAQAPPIRRIGTPAEFAAAAVFLASEPARYITGTVLSIDGGLTRSIL